MILVKCVLARAIAYDFTWVWPKGVEALGFKPMMLCADGPYHEVRFVKGDHRG